MAKEKLSKKEIKRIKSLLKKRKEFSKLMGKVCSVDQVRQTSSDDLRYTWSKKIEDELGYSRKNFHVLNAISAASYVFNQYGSEKDMKFDDIRVEHYKLMVAMCFVIHGVESTKNHVTLYIDKNKDNQYICIYQADCFVQGNKVKDYRYRMNHNVVGHRFIHAAVEA